MSKKPKQYEIETMEQLINIVTPENFDRISIDFILWLNYISESFAKIKENEEYKNTPNSELAKCKFVWIDDGKHELKKAKIVNTTTGEITNIKYKK